MKKSLSISKVIVTFGLLLVLGFTAVVGTGVYSLRELKVGGPLTPISSWATTWLPISFLRRPMC